MLNSLFIHILRGHLGIGKWRALGKSGFEIRNETATKSTPGVCVTENKWEKVWGEESDELLFIGRILELFRI